MSGAEGRTGPPVAGGARVRALGMDPRLDPDVAAHHLAEIPARSTVTGAVSVLATLILLAVTGVASGSLGALPWWVVPVLAGGTLVAWRFREPYPAHLAVLATLTAAAVSLPGLGFHPFPLLAALCAYAVAVMRYPRLRDSLDWLRPGAWDRSTRLLTLLVGLVPLAFLPAWYLLADPDVEWALATVAGFPAWVLPAAAVGFALINAICEEVAFRGVLFDAAASAVGVRAGLLIQAAAFGLVHAEGVPSGAWGVALSAVYGLLLGLLRLRARGMLAPIAAHVLADLIVFGLLLSWGF